MSELKLNIKDAKLIAELEEGETNISRIAKKIGVSSEVATYRINRLIESKFITGFKPIVDYSILGFSRYKLTLNLHNFKKDAKAKLIEELQKLTKTKIRNYIQSKKDVELIFWSKNLARTEDELRNIIEKHHSIIKDKELILITKEYLLNHAYLHGRKGNVLIGGQAENFELDKTDELLLLQLEKGADYGFIALAKHTGIPASTVASRMKSLIQKGILKKIIPAINPAIIKYDSYDIDISLKTTTNKKRLIEFLIQSKNVTRIREYFGRYDLGFEIDFKTADELDDFLEKIREDEFGVADFEIQMFKN